jgi:hypothetical protein
MSKHHAIKTHGGGGVEVQLEAFLTPYYTEVSGKHHALAALPPEKEHPVPVGRIW